MNGWIAIVLALIGIGGTMLKVWLSHKLEQQNARIRKQESECEKRLESAENRILELETDLKQATQYWIQEKKHPS